MTTTTKTSSYLILAGLCTISGLSAFNAASLDNNQPQPESQTPAVVVPIAPVPTATPEVIPPEAVLPQETVPAVVPTPAPPRARHHHHKKARHDYRPQIIVGVTNPVSHNEEETMHPTRAYCTRLGNPKSLATDRPKVCFERDMITGKIYRIPN